MNRLRAYRHIEGLTQQELAQQLGVSVSQVSAMEKGTRPVTDLPATGYRSDRLALPDASDSLHRQRASTKAPRRNKARELLRLGGEVAIELSRSVSVPTRGVLERTATPMSDDDVEEAALETRSMLDLPTEGPVQNLTAAAERAGVVLIPFVGLAGIDGMSCWVDHTVPVVGLATGVPGDRFRFTLAHELGHLVMHRDSSPTAEDEANQFAGALLIARDELEDAVPHNPVLSDFIALKNQYGISVAALVYRSHQLGLIDAHRYRSLQIQMSPWRKREPAAFEPRYGTRQRRLVEERGGVDAVASELGIPATHIRLLTNWSHLTVAA